MAHIDINKSQLDSPNCKIQRKGKNNAKCKVQATKNIEPKTVIWFEVASVYSGTSMLEESQYHSILPEWCQKQIECSVIHKMIPFIHQSDWMLVYHILIKMQNESFNFENLFPISHKPDIFQMSATDWIICRMLAKTFATDAIFVANIHHCVKNNVFPLFPKNCPRFLIGHAIFPFTSFFQRSNNPSVTNAQVCIELGYESDIPSITVISQKQIKKGEEIVLSCELHNLSAAKLSPTQNFGVVPKNFKETLTLTSELTQSDNNYLLKSLVTIFNEQCLIYGSKLNGEFSDTDMIKICSIIESKFDLAPNISACLYLWRNPHRSNTVCTPKALAQLCGIMDKLYHCDLMKHDLLESYIISHCVSCHNLLISGGGQDEKTLFCYSILCSPAFIASWALKQYSLLMARHSTLYKLS